MENKENPGGEEPQMQAADDQLKWPPLGHRV